MKMRVRTGWSRRDGYTTRNVVLHEGVHTGFLALWARSFLSTWSIAFPAALVVAPLVRRIVTRVTQAPLQVTTRQGSPC